MNRLIKTLSVTVMILVCTSLVFAAPFSPSPLRFSVSEKIQYDFDGSQLEIPLTVTGKPAALFFLVYTKDKGEEIGEFQNGFLGWHYINKIDTCVYVSPMTQVDIGKNVIRWDGKDTYGSTVPAGDYTYYFWGYDNISEGLKLSESSVVGMGGYDDNLGIQEIGEDGLAMANPAWYSCVRGNNIYKWIIGTDPADTTMVESTHMVFGEGWKYRGHPCLQPDDHFNFFPQIANDDVMNLAVIKLRWVPRGDTEIVQEWGEQENGMTTFSGLSDPQPGCSTDGGDYIFTGQSQRNKMTEPVAKIVVLDIHDGTLLQSFDVSNWWSRPDDLEKGGKMNAGPDESIFRDGYMLLSGECSCLRQMVDPYVEDEDDLVKWTNGNGDGTYDYNFEPDSPRPWVCNDTGAAPHTYHWEADANRFGQGTCYDLGAVTWGLIAPDGTGLGYMAVAGETATHRVGQNICHNGSAYDGIYKDQGQLFDFRSGYPQLHYLLWYGHDSIKGTITSAPVSVDESAPSEFAVAQNSPNPFNPTTTITFTTPESGNVTVDVFNVAGQKIDTIVSEYMNAGNHSIVWDGNGFSAGVYFYSVTSGSYLKTMKMTLIK